ncbi:UNVERIFIED_CONTAM: hypothetical protein HDU68_010436 [Siphonaria sp. JEL0065]|nr:hypothetical protein HDU68_010436 [Siphonaria sp. JEL0065]
MVKKEAPHKTKKDFKGTKGKAKVKPYTFKPKNGKEREELISYDDASRSDYLTGFRKRNLERIKKAKERDANLEKAEKREARKEKRNKISSVFEDIAHIEAVSEAAKKAKEERAALGLSDKATVDKRTIAGGKKIVTVTIEEMDL